VVVPAFKSWLRDLRIPAWLDARILSSEQLPYANTDLDAHSTTLRPDLGFVGRPKTRDAWFDHWSERLCGPRECPQRGFCPLGLGAPLDADAGMFSTATHMFEQLVVASGCLEESAFVGRSQNTGGYGDLLSKLGVADGSKTRALLDALGFRGRVVGYQFSNSDGIHGWLDPVESNEMAIELHQLDLPSYEPTLERLRWFADLNRRLTLEHRWNRSWPDTEWPESDRFPWEAFSLSYVRTICEIAAADGKGVLWGNDVSSDDDVIRLMAGETAASGPPAKVVWIPNRPDLDPNVIH